MFWQFLLIEDSSCSTSFQVKPCKFYRCYCFISRKVQYWLISHQPENNMLVIGIIIPVMRLNNVICICILKKKTSLKRYRQAPELRLNSCFTLFFEDFIWVIPTGVVQRIPNKMFFFHNKCEKHTPIPSHEILLEHVLKKTMGQFIIHIKTGWWFQPYPSEKYEFVNGFRMTSHIWNGK